MAPQPLRIGWLSTVCVDCGRWGWCTQTGGQCNSCETGIYYRQGLFQFYLCPSCLGENPVCPDCYGNGYIAVPREDMTQDMVEAEIAEMDADRNRPPTPTFQSEKLEHKWQGKKRSRRRR